MALLNIIILIAMLGLFIFMIRYTAYRLHIHFSTIPFRTWTVAVSAATIGSIAATAGTLGFSGSIASVINIIGGYILLLFVFSFVFLLIMHVVRIFWAPALTMSGIAALSIALIVTITGAIMGSSFVVRETTIKIAGLENELTIMLITDAHIGHHRGQGYVTEIVRETNNKNPDLIIIAGDLVESEIALRPGVLDPLSDFNAPVYFVEGNHEEYLDSSRVFQLLMQQGVRVLRNEIVQTHGIQLTGLDYMKADDETFDMHPTDKTGTVKSTLGELSLNSDFPTILVHHSPVGIQYAEAAEIDLVLSGHTHGGQIFPFSLFAKISFPYNSGIYHRGDTKVFVSNGAGTYMIRARLGSLNEINLLRLIPER